MEIHLYKTEEVENAHQLISELAGRRYNLSPNPEVNIASNGKPYFKDIDFVHFSVSHSGGIWALAMHDKPVGLDIEFRKKRLDNYLKLAERFFTVQEYDYVKMNGLGGFLRIWVRKEACLKLTGQGLSGGLRSFTVIGNKGMKRKTDMGYVIEFSVMKDFYVAICTKDCIRKKDISIILQGSLREPILGE